MERTITLIFLFLVIGVITCFYRMLCKAFGKWDEFVYIERFGVLCMTVFALVLSTGFFLFASFIFIHVWFFR